MYQNITAFSPVVRNLLPEETAQASLEVEKVPDETTAL